MSAQFGPADLGRIQRIDARQVWKREALEFTPWLQEHIDQLNEAIGFEIEVIGREEPVGAFAVDLFGKDIQTGQPAIIENQLAPTDHNHLGQLLTYAAGLNAGVVVWICPEFRDEHRQALVWLNENTPENVNFFGVELEIIEINGQRAPNFKLAVQPNTWRKQQAARMGRERDGEHSDRMAKYQNYFADLLRDLKARSPGVTTASKTQPANWFMFSAGRSGVSFCWSFAGGGRFRVELLVEPREGARNQAIFNELAAEREAIEQALGFPLEWEPMEHAQSKRVAIYAPFPVSIDSPEDDLERLKAWAVDSMVKFVEVFRPRIKALPL